MRIPSLPDARPCRGHRGSFRLGVSRREVEPLVVPREPRFEHFKIDTIFPIAVR